MSNAQTITTDQISILKAEMKALKRERKEQSLALKKSKQWVKTKKRFPKPLATDGGWFEGTVRVIAWHDGHMDLCWYDEDKNIFQKYNGTMAVYPEDTVENVSHWMQSDWQIKGFYIPAHGPGIKNFLLCHWENLTGKASDMAYDMSPKSWSRGNAQLDKKVVYYRNRAGKVSLGLPEDRPAPKGCQKIVCNNVFEAERYSELQRRQERSEQRMTMEQREQVEGAAQKEWRSNAHNLMMNARNQVNREFMEAALKRNAEHRPWEYTRESYLHNEG